MAIQWPATLLSYCRRLTGKEAANAAEDLLQQTLLRTLPVVVGRKQHPNPEAYLRQTAKHLWVDHVRSAKRRELPTGDAIDVAVHLERDASPESMYGSKLDTEAAFQVMLTLLTPLERTILMLHDVYAFTAAETADQMQTTETAVKAALRRSRKKIRLWREEGHFAVSPTPDDVDAVLEAYLAAFRKHDIPALIELTRSHGTHQATCMAA